MTQDERQLYALVKERVRLQKVKDGIISRVFGNYTIHHDFKRNATDLKSVIYPLLITSPISIYNVSQLCNDDELCVLKEWTLHTVKTNKELVTRRLLTRLVLYGFLHERLVDYYITAHHSID